MINKVACFSISLPSPPQGLISQYTSPFISRAEGLHAYHRMKNLCGKLHKCSIVREMLLLIFRDFYCSTKPLEIHI